MDREYHKWYSDRLGREMEVLVFGHAGARVVVFPARFGRFYDYENWGLIESSRHRIDNGWLQFYCVDGIDGEALYSDRHHPRERIERHLRYQGYVIEEVLPLSRAKNANPALIAHGCSLGAYHAVNVALRHPHLFTKVVAFSGRYDLTAPVGEFRGLLDGYYDDDVYFNTPNHFVPNLDNPWVLDPIKRMEIILAIGEQDPFLDDNRRLSTRLWDKGAWNALHVWGGRAHRPREWREMARLYL
jgi:esterase/lipase superfamily enzyme